MTNPPNYIDTRKRKSYSQQALFEEEPEEPTVVQPEPVSELKPPEPVIEKKEEELETIEEPKPVEELPVTQKTEPCEKCKQPITYRSDDFHPGILCPHCKNGQKNPNLKHRGLF